MDSVLRVNNLVKGYKGTEVLHGISFHVLKGEIFSLLGANGAGKTTTLECMEGVSPWEKGEICYTKRTRGESLRDYIGIQLQSSSLPESMTIREIFELFQAAAGRKKDSGLQERFGLAQLMNKQYGHLSAGQKRRLHLALALIRRPEILYLDEPTAGLDIEGQASLHEEIKAFKAEGKTVIMASHDMAEIEKLCDRIGVIREGRMEYEGTTGDFVELLGDKIYTELRITGIEEKAVTKLPGFEGRRDNYCRFRLKEVGEDLYYLLGELRSNGADILDIRFEHPTLEEKFLEFLRKEKAS